MFLSLAFYLQAMNRLLWITIAVIAWHVTVGQETLTAEMIEKAVETYEIPAANSVLTDDLTDHTLNPMDLNNASMKEIEQIPFLSADESFRLQEYILNYGEIFSLYELQAISGFDSALIRRIEPYIIIRPKSEFPALTPRNLFRYGKHDLLLRFSRTFPDAAGFIAGDSEKLARPGYFYPGDAAKYSFRYNYNWFGKVRAGIAGEKDPGEEFFAGNQSGGMDHYSAYVALQNTGVLQTLVVGNFRAGFGQGLTFGQGLSMNSSPSSGKISAFTEGIRPSTGLNEINYLRGIAVSVKTGAWSLSGFCSYHPRDATVTMGDSNRDIFYFSSFSQSGYHRTNLEVSKRNTIRELVTGGNIRFSRALSQVAGIRIGVTGVYYRFSGMMTKSNEPYKLFSMEGNQNLVTGMDYFFRYRNIYLKGEISRSKNGGIAWISGISFIPATKLQADIVVRSYDAGYQNIFGSSFGQYSGNSNENGCYLNLTATPFSKLVISGFTDFYKSPWLRYRTDLPVFGKEWGVLVNWTPNRQINFRFRMVEKTTRTNWNADGNRKMAFLADSRTTHYQFLMDWNITDFSTFTTRIDLSSFNIASNSDRPGICFTENFTWQHPGILNSIICRFTLFDIPSYNCRIYIFEPEVLFGYSVPAYQGYGIRSITVLKIKLYRNISFWIRGGYSWYGDRNSMGTGLDMIKGNQQVDFTSQVVLKL